MWWNWSLFTDLKVCSFGNLITFKGKRINYGRQEGHPACKKTEWWGAGVVICLERGADLHMVQLMPLPLTVSCYSKIQIGFTFLVPAHPGSPRKGPLNGCCCCQSNTAEGVATDHCKKVVNAKWRTARVIISLFLPNQSRGHIVSPRDNLFLSLRRYALAQ